MVDSHSTGKLTETDGPKPCDPRLTVTRSPDAALVCRIQWVGPDSVKSSRAAEGKRSPASSLVSQSPPPESTGPPANMPARFGRDVPSRASARVGRHVRPAFREISARIWWYMGHKDASAAGLFPVCCHAASTLQAVDNVRKLNSGTETSAWHANCSQRKVIT